MNISNYYFPNIGYTHFALSEEELFSIKHEIYEIQKNNFNKITFNHNLAGNIEKEFELTNCKDYLQNLLLPAIEEFDKEFNYFRTVNILTKSRPLILDGAWVNFQSKHEFNPHHSHSGVFSFVIWINIPYLIENEKENPSSKNSNANYPGHFAFQYTNSLGKILSEYIPADQKFNNQGLLFPSNMQHVVYPFFTTDEYRISISGNFKIDSS